MSESISRYAALRSARLKRAVHNPASGKNPSGFVRSAYGILLRKNVLDATFHFCKRGSYDRLLADYLQHQTHPFRFIDIGANQGLYSILAAQQDQCQQVVAFEPVARTFSMLEQNLQANKVTQKVRPLRAAISRETTTARIVKTPGHSGAASLRTLTPWFRATETISTIGPDSLRNWIPSDVGLIIKVDVEGHEAVVLGALVTSGVLNQARAIYYEVNPRWSDQDTLKNLLLRHGFTDFVCTSAKPSYDVLATRPSNAC
ncbi:MAG: FkbM family methyltransferase [Saccharospirillum sp.]